MNEAVNKNEGHGHVYPRPDGVKARCGGPSMCTVCAADLARKMQERQDAMDSPQLPQAGRPQNATLLQRLLDAREEAAHRHQQYKAAEAAYTAAEQARAEAETAVKTIPELQSGSAIVHGDKVFTMSRNMGFSNDREYTLYVFPLVQS